MTSIQELSDALDSIRPYLLEDGGDIEVLSLDEHGVVKVRMSGNCRVCLHKESTIKAGIELVLKEKFKDVVSVIEDTTKVK